MPISMNDHIYYMIAEACDITGTNRSTVLRWIREGRFDDVKTRDRNGWRLFSEADLERLKTEVNKNEYPSPFNLELVENRTGRYSSLSKLRFPEQPGPLFRSQSGPGSFLQSSPKQLGT